MEIITWRQLNSHNKPIMLFNYDGYWDRLITMWHQASEAGFIRPPQLNLADSVEDLDGLADFLDQLEVQLIPIQHEKPQISPDLILPFPWLRRKKTHAYIWGISKWLKSK